MQKKAISRRKNCRILIKISWIKILRNFLRVLASRRKNAENWPKTFWLKFCEIFCVFWPLAEKTQKINQNQFDRNTAKFTVKNNKVDNVIYLVVKFECHKRCVYGLLLVLGDEVKESLCVSNHFCSKKWNWMDTNDQKCLQFIPTTRRKLAEI